MYQVAFKNNFLEKISVLAYSTLVPLGRGDRVVEGTGLENRQAREGLVGSNPTPSAKDTVRMTKFFKNSDSFLEIVQALQSEINVNLLTFLYLKKLSSAQ